jgi:hypothetical protein
MSDRKQSCMKVSSLASSEDFGKRFLGPRPERGGVLLQRFAPHSQDHIPGSSIPAVHRKRDEAVSFQRAQGMT